MKDTRTHTNTHTHTSTHASTLEQQLRSAGLKPTLPRMEILRAFRADNRAHVTAAELYLEFQRSGNAIGIATVYRVLADLESHGIIKRVQIGNGKARFELANTGRHFHIVDVNGGEIVELSDPMLLARLDELVAQEGYRIVDLQLNVYVQAV
ncbi:Ferric uptake regulation protein [Paraburkholderia tropica]|uniref:Fur family transcriptional regulator n=1 Tax=Paraburkholderia tropica TaxID=92647 RepID=UPI001CB39A82|nr:Fur family transcriptional regulator [Paraburkholderia tropica]CAG9234938.1 Ferric uptake regulation protein [Paraburkholderia tropica]